MGVRSQRGDMMSQRNERQERWLVGAIITAFALLAAGFSLGPIFEGPDETQHYQYIRVLKYERELPDPFGQYFRPLNTATLHHAPLYYLLALPVALLIDDSDYVDSGFERYNPFFPYEIGIVGSDNKNISLHTRNERLGANTPGYVWAVHALRGVSVLMGTATVFTCWRIFRLLWPGDPARRALALACVAFWPQFIYVSSVINNDNLLILLATLALYTLLIQLRDGPTLRNSAALGLVLGAALLTKVNATFLALPVSVAILLQARHWRRWMRCVPVIGGTAALVAGWWYLRNWIINGDPINRRAFDTVSGAIPIRGGAIALDVGIPRLPFAYETAWARFGHGGSVPVPEVFYSAFDVVMIAACLGLALLLGRWARRLFRRRALSSSLSLPFGVLIIVFVLTWFGLLVYVTSIDWQGAIGRYVLPGIAGWAALVVTGLAAWLPRRALAPLAWVAPPGLGVMCAVFLLAFYLPAYQVRPAAEPERALEILYGDPNAPYAVLTGISPAYPHARPGEIIALTLHWRALRPADANYVVSLHSVGSDVVRRDSHPATGNRLATDWRPGETWAERYVVRIPATAAPNTAFPLTVGLYDMAAQTSPRTTNPAGDDITPIVGQIAILPTRSAAAQPAYVLENAIGLSAPEITPSGGGVQVCLRWWALDAALTTDAHTFVHLYDPAGALFAQADFAPLDGAYPTSIWQRGDEIAECATLPAPDSAVTDGWTVGIGMYTPSDGRRLGIVPQGEAAPLADGVLRVPLEEAIPRQ